MDELKKYLQSQRAELETEVPAEAVWQGIRKGMETAVSRPSIGRWMAAASLILVAGLGIYLLTKTSHPQTSIVKNLPKEKLPTAQQQTGSPIQNPAPEIKEQVLVAVPKQNNFPAAAPITTLHTVRELHQDDSRTMHTLEANFTAVINLQKARIRTTPIFAESPNYFKDFQLQLTQMEKDEKQIKLDIQKNGMNNELLDQLINVYQQKLTMLKQLQNEMQKLNSRYKQNRPDVDSLKTYFLQL